MKLRGTVTYCDPGWSLLFVQDSTGGVFVRSQDPKLDLHAGEEIDLQGITERGGLNPIVDQPSVKRLGTGTLPAARLFTAGELTLGRMDCQRVEVGGIVRVARDYWGRGYLELLSDGQRLKVFVLNFPGKDFEKLVGAKVRARGVCATLSENGKLLAVQLMVPDVSEIVIEEKNTGDPFARPVTSQQALKTIPPDHQVRVEGMITSVNSNQWVRVKDLDGEIQLALPDTSRLFTNLWLDAVGFPVAATNRSVLEDVIFRRVGYGAATLALRQRLAGQTSVSTNSLPLMKTVARVRELTSEEAAKRYPVRLGGVITYHDPVWQMIFFQGATEGIYVDAGGVALDLQAGQLAFLEGFSAPGNFAPVVESPVFHLMGTAPMPESRPVTSSQILSGDNDSQWLEMHGVVQGLTNEGNRLTLELASGNSRFKAVVLNRDEKAVPFELLDAEVRLRGVCGSLFNKNRQFLGVQLYVPDLAFVELEKTAPAADKFPAVPVQDLLRFKSKGAGGHRVRVQGTVTFAPAKNFFYLDDDTGGLRVTLLNNSTWQPGDFVEVTGFPATGENYSPILERALVRKLGSRPLPPPVPFQPGESLEKNLAAHNLDARRVQAQGRLVDQFTRAGEKILVLQSGQTLFNVHLPQKSSSRKSSDWRIGSLIRLTGVCSIQVDEARNPRAFSLLLAASDDLSLLSQPSWWTLEKTAGLAALLVFLVLVSSLSAVSLRRSVRRQTRLIRAQQEALQHAYDDLEKRVEERTAELVRANERLTVEIEERKKAHEDLAYERQLLGAMMDNVPDPIYFKDTASRFLRVNRAGLHAFGLHDPAQTIGKTDFDFFDEKHAGPARADEQEILRTGEPLLGKEEKEVYSDGRVKWMLTSKMPLRDAAGQITGTFGISRDITARKRAEEELQQAHSDLEKRVEERTAELLQANQRLITEIGVRELAEEELRQSQERFLKAFRASPIPIDISRFSDGAYLDVNESFLRMLGYTREEIIGQSALDLHIWVDPAERVGLIQRLLQQKSVRDAEIKLRTKNGRIRNVLTSAEFIEVGQERCLLFIVFDITDRLNLETQLRQSQKMQAVGQLAAGVAHDFNNILTVIQGHVGLMLSDDQTTSEQLEPLEQVASAAARAAHLTRQLLTFSRKQLMQPKQIDLNEVIGNAAKMLTRLLGENISLRFDYSPALPPVWADTAMMEQIVLNLAVNARDAMPRGGQLSLSTRPVSRDELHPSKAAQVQTGHFICLTVADTGYGMDTAVLERIFEPFFTTKDVGRGTGLGLAMVYGIVQQHQGWIEVASEVEKGSTFQIYLPVSQRTAAPDKPAAPAGTRGGDETILIVEDEAAVRLLVKTILTRYGYTVLEAAHAREALQIWEKEKDRIALMLTDMVMPEGISGWDLAEELKAQFPGFKVIFTSGYSVDLFENNREFREGVNFVSKPYQPHLLAKAIRDRLDAEQPVKNP